MTKEKFLSWLGMRVLRLLCRTLRFHIEDRCGMGEKAVKTPVIWAFWHNRMLIVPYLYEQFFQHRRGAVLTSASKDGAIIADLMKRFGVGAVRGSTSRGGSAALLELSRWISHGFDVAITPDGPRGPKYHLGPGLIFLAQKYQTPILPIDVRYSRCFRLKSWDGFMIPLPFSRAEITLGELQYLKPTQTDSEFEAERARLEQFLQPKMI